MATDATGGFRGFLRSRAGRVALILIALGAVFGTFSYIDPLLAIPVFLLVGLALPIWAGIKRPRYLALTGLIVLIVVAPLATIVYSQELLVPTPAVSSPGVGDDEIGGSVLQNATVSPFTAGAGTNFTWTVQVFPRYLASSLNTTNWTNDSLQLYISTCPGATTPNASYCGGGYPFLTRTHAFAGPHAPANGTVVTFDQALSTSTIWSWQMELLFQNRTNASNPFRIELSGEAGYNGIEGPIVGGFVTAYGALIGTIYEIELIYLGVVFYFVLLLYAWFKSREAKRKQLIKRAAQSMVASQSPAAGATSGAGPSRTASTPGPGELKCPACGAVVYPSEAKCWKCGGPLGAPSTPLPSGPDTPKTGAN
jgi:hypothetical protein